MDEMFDLGIHKHTDTALSCTNQSILVVISWRSFTAEKVGLLPDSTSELLESFTSQLVLLEAHYLYVLIKG
jgi:hypothetical protein